MKLTLLGTGTALPVPHRGPTGSWIHTLRASVLVDCGSGVVQKLVRAGADLLELDAVLLTHAHLDHIGDLPTLLFALRQLGERRKRPLRIVHSKPMAAWITRLREAYGDWLEPRGFPVTWQAVGPYDRVEIGDLWVRVFSVAHHETSVGYRFEAPGGETLGIPSDTGKHASVVAGVTGVDVLVIECSTTNEKPREDHLSPREVLEVLWEAAPRAAIITHLSPEAEAANVVSAIKPEAPCPVWEARDGLTVQVVRGGMSFMAEAPATPAARKDEKRPAKPPKKAADLPPDPEFAQLLEESMAAVDPAELRRQKGAAARRAPAPAQAPIPHPLNEQALRGLTPSRAQKALLDEAKRAHTLAEVNLHGLPRQKAMTQMRSALLTWKASGVRIARIITGKGKHSQEEPVIKIAVLEWLETEEGGKWIESWAPELAKDGRFGSVIVALRP